ncbi:hypothetical protein C8R45DRAFT_942332 [Mycena sanguinolenta]|nr:hypothetical protein C8R45DRAFT_942332 [Mycena sanguinolenta]
MARTQKGADTSVTSETLDSESTPATGEDLSKSGRKTRARKARESSNAPEDTVETTAPPRKKAKTNKTKTVEDTEFDPPAGSQDSETPTTAPSTKRKKKKKPTEEVPILPQSIVILVPTIHGASQRVSIPYDSDFNDAATAIFDAIPCSDVPLKPTLSYKLNSKSGKILLTDDDSWSSLRSVVVTRLNDKKKASTDAIDICLSPDNYLVSLQLRKNPKLVKTLKNGKRMAKDVLDLEHRDQAEADEDDVGGELSVMEKEQEKLAELERKHQGKCQKCAADQPEVWCKIDKSGAHTPITYVMRNSWAHSLNFRHSEAIKALEEHGVTLDNPPNTSLFAVFHKKRDDPSLTKSSIASASTSTSMMDVFMVGMMEQSKMNTTLLATIASGSSIRRYPSAGSPSRRLQPATAPTTVAAAPPAADVPDPKNEDIVEFFNYLDTVEARRCAGRYLDALIEEEVFTVGDIIRQGKEDLESSVIGMKSTLAGWVVELARKRVQ